MQTKDRGKQMRMMTNRNTGNRSKQNIGKRSKQNTGNRSKQNIGNRSKQDKNQWKEEQMQKKTTDCLGQMKKKTKRERVLM